MADDNQRARRNCSSSGAERLRSARARSRRGTYRPALSARNELVEKEENRKRSRQDASGTKGKGESKTSWRDASATLREQRCVQS